MYDATADFWLVCKLVFVGVLILLSVETIGQAVERFRKQRTCR